MKTFARISITLGLVFAIFASTSPGNAALVSYSSGISVQNLQSTTATAWLYYYNPDGTLAVPSPPSITINAYDSKTIFPLTHPPAGFDGSMVVSSDRQINAVSRITGSDGVNPLAYGAAYSGAVSGDTSVFLPLLYKNNYNANSWFSVQNVGGAATSVSVVYDDAVTAGPVTIQPGAAAKFEQKNEAHASGWIGSGTVTSTAAPIAAVVLQVDDSPGFPSLFAYNGFTTDSLLPVFPLAYANNFGTWIGIAIQNTGSVSTDVTVAYTHSPGYSGTDCIEQRRIPANSQINFMLFVFWPNAAADPDPTSLLTNTCVRNELFIGSAKVTVNSASQPLVSIVNQKKYFDPSSQAGSYNAFDPAPGTSTVAFAEIMDRNGNFFSGWSLVNVGSSTILNSQLSCTVRGLDGLNNPVTMSFSPPTNIPVGGVWTEVQYNKIASGFIGSAICTGPAGSKMVGIGQYVDILSAGDYLYVYEGFNQ